jgi:sulfatase modifying factor 1
MKKQIILYMLCVFALVANAQPIPQSIKKTPTPKTQKAPQKVVVIQKPVYIVKNNDRDGDGLSDAIDECPDEKGSPKNSGCPEKTVSIPLPEMIEVPGGSFTMGGMNGRESPSHSVTLSSFRMAKTETTVAQYRAYCKATGQEIRYKGWTDKEPIVHVSWDDAVAYCKWLSDKTAKFYRLPTEAEWEYAARGGNKSNGYEYSGSDVSSAVSWNTENSDRGIHDCGLKKPNELGLYDMSGNVYEWCQDWYGRYDADSQTNPNGAKTGSYRVLRGGCFLSVAAICRVADRDYNSPDFSNFCLGFRVVLSQ